jgi:hypothetical protein
MKCRAAYQKETPAIWLGSLFGAGDETRTHDIQLGKLTFYH